VTAQPTDSLKQLLFQSTSITEKAVLYNQITWSSHLYHQDSAVIWGQQAIEFCSKNNIQEALAIAYIQLGEILSLENDLVTAMTYLNKATPLIKENQHWIEAPIRCLLLEGRLATKQQDNTKALNLLAKGYALDKKHNTNFCADFCILIANVHEKQGAYNNAIANLNKGLYCTINTEQRITLCNNLGNLYVSLDSISKALELYTKNLKLASSINNKLEESRAYLNIGNIHYLKSVWSKALEFYLKSAVIKETIDDQRGLAELHQNIAAIYQTQDRYDKTIEYYNKSIRYYNQTKDSSKLAELQISLGIIYMQEGDFNDAIQNITTVLNTFSKYLSPPLILYAQTNLASTYMYMGNFPKALEYFNLALDEATKQEDYSSIANIYNFLGGTYFYMEDYPKSIDHYKKALPISQRLDLISDQESALFGLYESNDYLGNSKEALDWYEKYIVIKDSLYNSATTNHILELQEQYDTKQKEQAIQQLNIENKNIALESELKTKQLNQFLLVIVLGALVMCILGIVWWYRNRQQQERMKHTKILHDKKVNQLINQQEIEMLDAVVDAQQKERKGVAKEIHDTLGSFLATLKYQHEAGKDLAASPAELEQFLLMEKLIGQTATEVRNIAHQMATGEKFDFDLKAAIDQLVNRIRGTQQFDLEFNYIGLVHPLPRDMELMLYRVTQELLSNILKHAQASEVVLQINQGESELMLMIEDDGKGFSSNNQQDGLGLRSIRERVEYFNGMVNIDSHPKRGTTVVLTIPIA